MSLLRNDILRILPYYEQLRPQDKIDLAIQVLLDVCADWDNDALVAYPHIPSFDEFVADLASTLAKIEWK